MSSGVPLRGVACCGKCASGTIFCNKRTGQDTVLVKTAHNKGRADEHCCLMLPERDRKGKKKPNKYIFSCVKDGYNTQWLTADISAADRNAFREWVEFGPTKNESSLRSGGAKWSADQLERRDEARKALDEHTRNVKKMTRRDHTMAKYVYNRDASFVPPPLLRSSPSISKEKASQQAHNDAPAKKKPRMADEKDVADFNAWRGRIKEHLRAYIDSMRCYELLDEMPPGYPVHKISHHNIALSHSKACIVYDYCSYMQSRDVPGSKMSGWAAVDCAECAGGTKSVATVFRYWEEYEASLGRSFPADYIGPRPIWDVAACDGKGTFQMDHRGQYERDWILGEEDYLFQFKREMKGNLKKLSVDHMTTWCNGVLFTDMDIETSNSFGIARPIRRGTVYSWMKRCGATNEAYCKSVGSLSFYVITQRFAYPPPLPFIFAPPSISVLQ